MATCKMDNNWCKRAVQCKLVGLKKESSMLNWHTLVGGDVDKSERGIRGSCCTTADAFGGLTTTNVRSDSCLVLVGGYRERARARESKWPAEGGWGRVGTISAGVWDEVSFIAVAERSGHLRICNRVQVGYQ